MVNVQIENDWPIKRLESLKGKKFIYLLEGKIITAKIRIDDQSYLR